MTQTPQPPTNEPEPLDAAERELARLLGNLPSAPPPPELDARILAAARRAVQQQPKRRPLGWWRSIGVGAAASAVLAVGLLVKLHGDGQGPSLPSESDLPGANVAAPEAAREQAAPAATVASDTTVAAEPAPQHVAVPPPPREIPPPPMPVARAPIHVGGQIQAPALAKRVEPVYPDVAVSARIRGVVILEALVDKEGRVVEVKVLRTPNQLLDNAAITAVRQWQYRPLILNGLPEPFVLTVVLTFELQDS